MIANPDRTLVAVYHDTNGGHYSRPILAIDNDYYCYVTDEHGDLIPADEWDDLAFIDNAIINGQEAHA